MLKVFALRPNEHIPHEEGMVGTRADNPNFDLVLLVPSCEAFDNIDSVSGIQVIDCSFSVDLPYLLYLISVRSGHGSSKRRVLSCDT